MQKLTPSDLFSLEAYARERPAFRARVLDHGSEVVAQLGVTARAVVDERFQFITFIRFIATRINNHTVAGLIIK